MGQLNTQHFLAVTQSMHESLTWHLQANHYPPIPVEFVEPCKEAIYLARQGLFDEVVELPEGCNRRGRRFVNVATIIDDLHLHSWVEE